MSDATAYAAVVLAFAMVVTAHVLIAFGLLLRGPGWRVPLALFVPPLAPYWAVREGMHVRGIVWLASVVAYAVLLFLARR